jgi:hypothetical protein
MKKLFIVLLLLAIPVTTSADESKGKFTKHFKESMFKVTKNGEFSVEIIVKQEGLKVGLNTFKIGLHDRNDHDLEDAKITITPWMPDMGHGVKTKPVVTDKGKGLYIVENIEFSMSGLWMLKVIVKKDDTEDKAIFTIPHIKSTKKF